MLSVVKDLFLPWYNALRFFTQNANRGPAEGGSEAAGGVISTFVADPAIAAASTNAMDRWVYAAVQVRRLWGPLQARRAPARRVRALWRLLRALTRIPPSRFATAPCRA